MDKKTIPERNGDTILLVQFLSKAIKGQVFTFAEMTAAIRRDVVRDRHILYSARDIALAEHSIVFESVRGVGIRRLDDAAITNTTPSVLRRIRRQSRRQTRKLSTVDCDKLTSEQKRELYVGASLMAVFQYAASRSQIKRLESAVSAVQARLPVGSVLDAIK